MKFWLLPLIGGILLAQDPLAGPDMTLDTAARAAVIDGGLKALNDNYVFPEVAKKMEQAIRERQQHRAYDSITSAREFAQTLMADIQQGSPDKHLRWPSRAEAV